MSQHEPQPVRTYVGVFAALLLLTATTVWASGLDFGWLNTPLALGIAAGKALLVGLFFMHLRGASGLIRLTAVGALLWLGILIFMTTGDYLRRDVVQGWDPPTHGPATPASSQGRGAR